MLSAPEQTTVDDFSRCHYRKRHEGDAWTSSTIPLLLLAWEGHVHVDFVFSVNIIFDVFKDLVKGVDRALIRLRTADQPDDLDGWFNARFVSICEATWRIFGMDITRKYPAVLSLSIQVKGQNRFQYAQGSMGHSTASDLIRYIDLRPFEPHFGSLTYE